MSAYSHHFFAAQAGTAAETITEMVADWLQPTSVLDVGCGLGVWLAEWQHKGAEVLGVDSEDIGLGDLLIEPTRFVSADLRRPLDLGRRFDLVMSLEVAEHLAEEHADDFVDSLTRHGDAVLFSAAIPGQGGERHVNCQWPSYWQAKFNTRGFTALDIVRPRIWEDERIAWWYRQNVIIYARNGSFEALQAQKAPVWPIDVVHPRWYLDMRAEQPLRTYSAEYFQRVFRAINRRRPRANRAS